MREGRQRFNANANANEKEMKSKVKSNKLSAEGSARFVGSRTGGDSGDSGDTS